MCHLMNMARLKKMVSFALDRDLIDQLDAWLEKQEIRPSKTAVVEAAIRQFLERAKVTK